MYYMPSFKIYGAVAGFYDYGPPGCAIKQNMTQARLPFLLRICGVVFSSSLATRSSFCLFCSEIYLAKCHT